MASFRLAITIVVLTLIETVLYPGDKMSLGPYLAHGILFAEDVLVGCSYLLDGRLYSADRIHCPQSWTIARHEHVSDVWLGNGARIEFQGMCDA